MSLTIALAGNPNTGKTTLFNALTGGNQSIGNWPGVTIEKKTGTLRGDKSVQIVDLPGIYSLSPFGLEEKIARDALISLKPDVIVNVVDATQPERNLYLTTQLTETEIPVVVALNMSDLLESKGLEIDTKKLSDLFGCYFIEVSAQKKTGLDELIAACREPKQLPARGRYDKTVEQVLDEIEAAVSKDVAKLSRFDVSCLLTRDALTKERLNLSKEEEQNVGEMIVQFESTHDDDADSLLASARYAFIGKTLEKAVRRKKKEKVTLTDRIDKVVTHRVFALPIFVAVMFLVYFFSVTWIGGMATDFVNDGIFGDGWFFGGSGREAYDEAVESYEADQVLVEGFEAAAEGLDEAELKMLEAEVVFYTEEGDIDSEEIVDYETYLAAVATEEPDPAEYGPWVSSIPDALESFLENIGTAPWLTDLVINGIVAGVGAVLGFLPQMLVLFFFLALLEGCGYMARVAFIMDRAFRRFGLSGKSFIPLVIGTGCSVPAIMATRTIEQERDRKLTVITTSFIPCGAKLPIIALIAGALFDGVWWVAPSAYFIGIGSVILSGLILKGLKKFAGDPAPFLLELPDYRVPTARNVLMSMGQRGWSFVRKAGTIILLASVLVWVTSSYGIEGGTLTATTMENSLLAAIGRLIAPLFAPLGFGFWQAAVATFTGLIAKENVVGTFGVLFGNLEVAENGWQIWPLMREVFTPLAAFSFLMYNLLTVPCFAAIGAMRRELGSRTQTLFAVIYQLLYSYAVTLIVYQIVLFVTGGGTIIGLLAALILTAAIFLLIRRPGKRALSGDHAVAGANR